jgi:hypothetical protein
MTQGERASLDRLEEKFDRWSERIEGKVDAIDGRLRDVEIQAATARGEKDERKEASSSRLQTAGIVLAAAVVLVGIPAAAVAVTTFVQLVGG